MNISQAREQLEIVRLSGDEQKFASSRFASKENGVAVCLCRLWLGRCSFTPQRTAEQRVLVLV